MSSTPANGFWIHKLNWTRNRLRKTGFAVNRIFDQVFVHLFGIQESFVLIGNKNDWMHKTYPSLEHFGCSNIVIAEVQTLSTLSLNIWKLSVYCGYIKRQAQSLLTSNIRLDALEVMVWPIDNEIFSQLNALYKRGFYQRLILYLLCHFQLNDEAIRQFPQLNVLLTFYMTDYSIGNIQLASLANLKDIRM